MAKLIDDAFDAAGNAVADVRSKYEEAVWGRAVTDGPERLQWPEPEQAEPSFGSSTHIREMEPQQDIDLDR